MAAALPLTSHTAPTYCTTRRFQLPAASSSSNARKLFTQGNNYDNRIKIAWKDGKHLVDRYVEKKGSEAVKKIDHGAGH